MLRGPILFGTLRKGNMEKRILELALEALEKQRTDVEAAIAEIRELQDGKRRIITRKPGMPALVVGKRRSRTPAERRAQAKRMREYWAKRKAGVAKVSAASRRLPAASAKRRAKTAAEKKALSLKMREIWKKRKAAAAKSKD